MKRLTRFVCALYTQPRLIGVSRKVGDKTLISQFYFYCVLAMRAASEKVQLNRTLVLFFPLVSSIARSLSLSLSLSLPLSLSPSLTLALSFREVLINARESNRRLCGVSLAHVG